MTQYLEKNIGEVKERIERAAALAGRAPGSVALVAASKTRDSQIVRRAIAAGIEICGENRVQEMLEKHGAGAYEGAKLHFIGHLQKNKVRQVVGLAGLIESVDSPELLALINGRAGSLNLIQDVLLELNIGGEASKSGLDPLRLSQTLELAETLSNIRVRGLMTIPPPALKEGENRVYFAQMYKLWVDISVKKYDNVSMDFLSMGMSGDFEDAIAEGANMVRVGTSIFGERYKP
jgi:pyridoxal phosphate enzyme (YggS family)